MNTVKEVFKFLGWFIICSNLIVFSFVLEMLMEDSVRLDVMNHSIPVMTRQAYFTGCMDGSLDLKNCNSWADSYKAEMQKTIGE